MPQLDMRQSVRRIAVRIVPEGIPIDDMDVMTDGEAGDGSPQFKRRAVSPMRRRAPSTGPESSLRYTFVGNCEGFTAEGAACCIHDSQ